MIEIRKADETLSKLLPPVKPRTDVVYIPSQYMLSFETGGKQYVFNNLTKQCIEGVLPESAMAGEEYDDLIQAQFLVPADKDECTYYNQISSLVRVYNKKKGVRGYTILPTFGCNARCIYCYEEGMKQVTMTPEIIEQTIRYIIDTHIGNTVKLSWFGGEPLLGVRIIDRICEGMREAELEYKSSMISNGSLITTEIIEKMAGDWHLDHIQISMDGAEADYKYRKHYRSYEDYYHQVMDAVSRMSEAGIAVNIRCNVDEGNWEHIPAFLDDLKAGIAHKEKVGLYCCPLNDVRMGEGDLPMWRKISEIRPLIEAAGFKTTPFLGLGLNFRVNHCMADGAGVVITPDGSLYPCEHCPAESRYGDIWNGVTDETAKRAFCQVDQTREKCRKCPFLPDCTSFAACPVQDTHCREVHEMMAIDALKRMVQKQESEGGESPIC